MTRQQAADYVRTHPELYLKPARRKGYVCPLCGNGTGPDGDGLSVARDGVHLKCFKGNCGFYGDMIDLIGQEYKLKGKDAFDKAFELYNLQVDDTDYTHTVRSTHNTEQVHETEVKMEDKQDFRSYVEEHRGAGCNYSYLENKRGISAETAELLGFGYDEDAQAVIIPCTLNGKMSYEWRYEDDSKGARGHWRPRGVWTGLFNEQALDQDEMPVFITESALDAASIVEINGQAVSYCGASNVKYLLDRLKQGCTCSRFIVYGDNDSSGAAADGNVIKGLEELDLRYVVMDKIDGCKDANEALVKDRKVFAETCVKAIEKFGPDGDKKMSKTDRRRVSCLIEQFAHYIQDAGSHKPMPTGMEGFDKAIGGGLYPRTYLLGAVTSLGKTTFVQQLMDGVAKAGGDVIIFSLEMMMEELIARSVSRETYEDVQADKRSNALFARSEQDILELCRRSYSLEQKDAIFSAIKRYMSYAGDHISIYEGKQTADKIRETVEGYVKETNRVPVVVVDYLQKLQPSNPDLIRAARRQQVDYDMAVFADMRRELKTPIILISSLSRGAYNGVVTAGSLKESGEIEYTGDCVMTMDLDADRYSLSDSNDG